MEIRGLSKTADYYEGLDRTPDRITTRKDWHHLFPAPLLKQAETPGIQKLITEMYENSRWNSNLFLTARMRRNDSARSYYTILIAGVPNKASQNWEDAQMTCDCPEGKKGMRCIHKAAALVHWEKEHGPFIIKESKQNYDERMRKLKEAAELTRRQKLLIETGDEDVPAMDFFRNRRSENGLVFFDLEKALSGFVTTPYYIARAKEVLSHNDGDSQPQGYTYDYAFGHGKPVQLQTARDGKQTIFINCSFYDGPWIGIAQGELAPDSFVNLSTAQTRGDYYYARNAIRILSTMKDDRFLDEYALAAVSRVWDYLDTRSDLGSTDEAAQHFFRNLEEERKKAARARQEITKPLEKQPVLTATPRIIIEDGSASLTLRIGYAGGRSYILRNISQLVRAYTGETVFELSKKETVDFAKLDFDEKSMPLILFAIRRVGEIGDINEKLEQKARWGRRPQSLSVSSKLDLKGSLLDNFYDIAEGMLCEYQDKNNGIKDALIPVEHRKLRFALKLERVGDARGNFAGVSVSGNIPVMIAGSSHNYILSSEALSRISADEQKALAPFLSVADASGYFRFQVGFDRLQEFYYRVLPALTAYPCVELEDTCAEEARSFLPPEPEFTFFLDYSNGILSCRATVQYEDKSFPLYPRDPSLNISGKTSGKSSIPPVRSKHVVIRDTEQENRVRAVLEADFSHFDHTLESFYREIDEDSLFRFLQEGIEELSGYGEVRGTDAFRKLRIQPVPQFSIGVSMSAGLMDLSVTSPDLKEEELLEILYSYRQKKRWHLLKSGDFIDLADNAQLEDMLRLFSELDVSPDEAIRQKAHLPMYRALYLDRLLEEHEQLVSSRDRTFRALARSFRTVRDAEYEVPESLAGTLRPYQSHGFKWLKTLENAGFGGILADEMGLGKTIQMISLILYDKEQGNTLPSLIVCPASLVYNWQEEIRRFAPALSCTALAGTQSARKKALQQTDSTDVYVTSYDLLKRDIALYENREFHLIVLDEAQYIKNAKAAAAKSVKTVKAHCRFALTGTPIENRLAELWSIFDFLMPGFLYSAKEFEKRYESPIAKQKDERASEQLKKLTGPFILRRRKEDVLKDLPAKLEEVRYVRIAGEQQKLYDAQVVRIKGLLGSSTGSGEEKMQVFSELTRIRQICCDPALLFEGYAGESAKREACLETIRSAIDGGHRILVFSQFTSMLALLEEDLKKEGIEYYKIIGATPKDKRISMVHAFNEGNVPVFLISLKAGGTGLNLTGADVVIHYDPWWNLAAQNQATDRAHRIGQTRQVTVYKLILKDTIEEKIMDLQDAKKDLAEAILEGAGSSIMQMSSEELMTLFD